jgi:hypothetical protein
MLMCRAGMPTDDCALLVEMLQESCDSRTASAALVVSGVRALMLGRRVEQKRFAGGEGAAHSTARRVPFVPVLQ